MALGIGEWVVIASVLTFILSVAFLKDEKMKKYLAVGGIAGAFFGVAAFGAFGLLTTGAPGDEPTAGGLWSVTLLDTSDTDRAEASELFSADLHSVTYSLSDADIDDVGDVDLNLRVLNMNTDELTTRIWVGSISIVSVGTVLVGGVASPIANYTADMTRFAITYTEDAGAGVVVQEAAKASFTATSGDFEDISVDMDVSDAVLDDMAAGQQVTLVYSLGGVTITCTLQDNGSVT